MITNPLSDLIPAKARKYVYGFVALAALVFGAWEVSNGDVETFIGAIITALVTALAASNVNGSSDNPDLSADGYADDE